MFRYQLKKKEEENFETSQSPIDEGQLKRLQGNLAPQKQLKSFEFQRY